MLIHASELLPEWQAQRAASGHMLIALDFDGTLAPIVPHPDEAQLLPHARTILQALAHRADTEIALISGRGLDDLRRRIGIPDIYYAGNHGLEIHGPDLDDTVSGALELVPAVQRCFAELQAALGAMHGVYLENKHLSLSVHYRRIDDPHEQQRVVDCVRRIFESDPAGLRLTSGKRVVEIRPDIDWHKGKALLYIIEEIESVRGAAMLPVFVGDDRTDEDGFMVLRGKGAGVLVGPRDAQTAAGSYVRTPDEAVALLERLL